MKPIGRVLEFHSPVDGLLHPCAICATDASPDPKPLIIEVSPAAIDHLDVAVRTTEEIAAIAAAAGEPCVVLRPTGRGPGTVYQHYGEIDVLEAIEFAASLYSIDRDRITITGASMGGAATWYLLSHYPDLFAAAAPFCGYADYRLWEKPGGLTFQLRPWEEPSWRSRSAALLLENLDRTPIWLVHGEWDRAVAGGVSVEHSRHMASALAQRGAPVRYTEVPGVGHDVSRPDFWPDVIRWLLEQRRAPDPNRIALATGTLRHNVSRWARIDQLARYGERGSVEARSAPEDVLDVATANVRTLTLGPMDGRAVTSIVIDDQMVGPVDLSHPRSFRRAPDGRWQPGTFVLSDEKRHGSSGPVGDLFFDATILVPGTIGDAASTFFNDWVAHEAAAFYRSRNGGVHRGGIMGVNYVDLPVVRDVDLTAAQRTTSNLVLYGSAESNQVIRDLGGRLPVAFGRDTLRLADREWRHPRVAAFAAFPHPEHASRYIAVHGGPAPDALTWGSHLDMALLPDYLVYAGGETLDWGFWGNDWRSQE